MDKAQSNYIEEIYNQNHKFVEQYVFAKCVSVLDAQDIIQNVFCSFVKRVKKYGVAFVISPKFYLKRIAKDELTDYYKEKQSFKNRITIDEVNDRNLPEVEVEDFLIQDNFADEKILCSEIWNEIKKLDDMTQKIFVFRFLYDNKFEVIAQKLKMPLSSVKSKFYRGISKLKAIFEEGKYEKQ